MFELERKDILGVKVSGLEIEKIVTDGQDIDIFIRVLMKVFNVVDECMGFYKLGFL